MINVQKLKQLTKAAVLNEQERQAALLAKEQAAADRERKAHQLMAETVISQIEDKCEQEANNQRSHAIIMGLKYRRDYDSGWPSVPTGDTLKGPGKIVYDFCEKEGLMPIIEDWHDGVGINSGYNIVVQWGG